MKTKNAIRSVLMFSALVAANAQSATRSVGLNWTASASSGVTGYNVFRVSGTGTPAQLNTAAVTGTSYTDTTAVVGSTYTYTVTSVAAACTATSATTCGQSAPSAPATLTVPPAPTPALNVTITVL